MSASIESQLSVLPESVTRIITIALKNAQAKGDPWWPLAEECLRPAEHLLTRIEVIRLDLLRKHAGPARAMTDMHENVLALLERLADAVWIERGQSPQDPFISILSPGTPHFFFDWNLGHPIDRLDILLELFDSENTPRAQSDEIAAILTEIRTLLPEFRELNEAVRASRAKLEVLQKAMDVVARVGHVQYSRLRRRMRADGFDAFEVRKVFPDIPGASGTMA